MSDRDARFRGAGVATRRSRPSGFYTPDSHAAALIAALLALFADGVGIAQDVISAKAGLVYFVLGRVSIAGSGRLSAGAANRQLNEGEILFSEAGRAEVLLNPGAVLRIGDVTRIRMDSTKLTDTRISIEAGSAVVTVNQLPRADRVEIHIGSAVVAIKDDGVYRFDADRLGTSAPRLRVLHGKAEAYREEETSPEDVRTVAKRGQEIRLEDLRVGKFDQNDADALQKWAEIRDMPPPLKLMPPMLCYSDPQSQAGTSNLNAFTDYVRECLHISVGTK